MKFTLEHIAEIKARASIVDVVSRGVKLTRKGHSYMACCPFHNEKTPSFHVNENKGTYHCYGCGAHGDAIEFLMAYYGMDFTSAVNDLADDVGIGGKKTTLKPIIQRRSDADEKISVEKKINEAKRIWAESKSGYGTMVQFYLEGRGINFATQEDFPPTLRFNPKTPYWNGEKYILKPAMIAPVQAANRQIVGIHKTFLEVCGEAKDNPLVKEVLNTFPDAKITKGACKVTKINEDRAKQLYGAVKGGAIRFAPANDVLFIAEGIESALSVMNASKASVWSCFSLPNFAALDLPEEVKKVILCFDNDEKDQDMANNIKHQALERFRQLGLEVYETRPDKGRDFNDMIQEVVL